MQYELRHQHPAYKSASMSNTSNVTSCNVTVKHIKACLYQTHVMYYIKSTEYIQRDATAAA